MLLLSFGKNFTLILSKNTNSFFCFDQFSSSTASKTLNPSPKSIPIVDFLINSCGFSSKRAANASKLISRVTIDQANSVRHFFEHHGFTDKLIQRLISNFPRILSADPSETLNPNLHALGKMGFNDSELKLLITSNPYALVNPLAIGRLEFWQTFLGANNRKDLVLVFRRNRNLITHNIESGIAPKFALLKEHGLSETDIIGIVKRGHCLIMRSTKTIETLLKTAEELVPGPKSPMFSHELSSLSGIGRDTFASKMELFKGFGWSEEDFFAAFKKAPYFIHLSKENLTEKMEFLRERAGCEQSYIVSNPLLLTFSLEKRLKPRHYVMKVLKLNEIVEKVRLYSIMCLPEKKFVERFILRYNEQVPKLHAIYIAACAGQIPI